MKESLKTFAISNVSQIDLSQTDNLKKGGSSSFIAAAADILGIENQKLTHLVMEIQTSFDFKITLSINALSISL